MGLKFNASRTTANSLTLNWQKPDACSQVKRFDIKYCEWNPTAKGCVTEEVFGNSKTNSFILISLKPFTNYAVWVKAVSLNESYQSDWSSSARNLTSKAGLCIKVSV